MENNSNIFHLADMMLEAFYKWSRRDKEYFADFLLLCNGEEIKGLYSYFGIGSGLYDSLYQEMTIRGLAV